MARQIGPSPLSGTIGNITYYHSPEGDIAKQKSSLTKQRVATDPAFEGSRNAAAAFRKAAKNAGLIRRTFIELIEYSADRRLSGRLTGTLQGLILADKVSKPGERKLQKEHLPRIIGFEFNKICALKELLRVDLVTSVDRRSGKAYLAVPSFKTKTLKECPDATHFRITVGASAMDFDSESCKVDIQSSEWVSLKLRTTTPVQFEFSVKPAKQFPVFMVASIQYCEMVNGTASEIRNKSRMAASIIAISV
jgi:hypothetical protein